MINQEELNEKLKPIIEWMNHFHPHTTLIVTATSAELLEGTVGLYTEEYLRD